MLTKEASYVVQKLLTQGSEQDASFVSMTYDLDKDL
jgi:hypothetical protein